MTWHEARCVRLCEPGIVDVFATQTNRTHTHTHKCDVEHDFVVYSLC